MSYVVDLSKVRVEAEGKLRGLPNAPPLLSFLLAVRLRQPSFVLAWPGLVRISLPLLVVAVGVPHLYSLTFAGPRLLLHSLACIGLRPCWPGPSLPRALVHAHLPAAPSFTSAYTPRTCFDLRSPVFICAHLVSITVVAVTHIISIYLIKCLAYLVMYLALLLLAITANIIVSIEDTYNNLLYMCCGM